MDSTVIHSEIPRLDSAYNFLLNFIARGYWGCCEVLYQLNGDLTACRIFDTVCYKSSFQ